MHDNHIHWYWLEFGQEIADHSSMMRAHHFEQFVGNPAIARVMGVDEQIGVEIWRSTRVYVCFDCYLHKPLAQLQELLAARNKAAEDQQETSS
jgi:hypothetical protein